MEEQQILRMSSYLNELVWSSSISGMEEQQIFQWDRIEESSPSQVNELIRYLKKLVLSSPYRDWKSSRFSCGTDRRILLTEPSL
jgi:hypothetical protein